jgi:2-C-methyl-D-erythritol 4-phosphate cytidylyltransferase
MTLAARPEDTTRLVALVPCAGVGERAGVGGPKQYALLAGRSILAHTVAALAAVPRIGSITVLVSPDDAAHPGHLAPGAARIAPCGGATRALTVRNGLDHLLESGLLPTDWVLVHDAARCLVRPEWVDALIDACIDDPVGGLLALPLADTLKEERDGRAVATIDRRAKWQAQTPQMFRLGPLRAALAAAGAEVTDEAGAMEALGHAPRLVPGSLENFKLTWPADFELAERLLRSRR